MVNWIKEFIRRKYDKEARLANKYTSKDGDFSQVYAKERSQGNRTFYYNGKYYNTDYEGAHGRQYREDVASGKAAAWEKQYPNFTNPELRKEKQEELDTYGITNEQTKNKTTFDKILHNNNARGYSIGNGISAIKGEYTPETYYETGEDAIAALNKKYKNKFKDFPLEIEKNDFQLFSDSPKWRFKHIDWNKLNDYRRKISEEDQQLFDMFKNDYEAHVFDPYRYTDQPREIHRPEYNLLLGYPYNASTKNSSFSGFKGFIPRISKYKTGSLPYYYTTQSIEESTPFLPSSISTIGTENNNRRISLQKQIDELESKIIDVPQIEGEDWWTHNSRVRKTNPKLFNKIDSLQELLLEPVNKAEGFANAIYDSQEAGDYWKERGVTTGEGTPYIYDMYKFIKNSSDKDIKEAGSIGMFDEFKEPVYDTNPGNYLANAGNEEYYQYDNNGLDVQSIYDVKINKIANWLKKAKLINNEDHNKYSSSRNKEYNQYGELVRDTNNGILNSKDWRINSEPSLGTYTLSIPKDKSFVSIWDIFDIDPFGSGNDKPLIKVGKPFEYYTRFYPENKTPNIDELYSNFKYKQGGIIKSIF